MITVYEMYDLLALLEETTAPNIIRAETRAFEKIDLPKRGPKGSKVNERRVELFTRALMKEL